MTKITNGITTGLVALGGYLTIEHIAPVLGLVAILLAIAVNILSYRNKRLEKKKTIIETELASEKLKQLKSTSK